MAAPDSATSTALRYVALGDSYTIGTSVRESERWPNQLVARLAAGRASSPLELVANLGVNGSTSRNLIDVELPALDGLRPEFVSLLIGVNDVVQGVAASRYAGNMAFILDDLLGRLPSDRIVIVTTPDYTVTAAGADYGDPMVRAAAIRDLNAVLRRLAGERGVAFVDIHDLSLLAATDPTFVASDGLHPSGTQYARWVDRLAPVVQSLVS